MELIRNSYETYTVLPQTDAQKEVSAEVIVPDTQADVYSVLTAFAVCQIKQRTLRQDALMLEGTVDITALCQEEDESRWQIIRGSVPFALEMDVPGCREGSPVQLRVEVLRCDALIRNPRKLQLQAQIGACVQLFRKDSLTVTESAGGSGEEDVQTLCDTVELELVRTVAEKKLVAADELQTEPQGSLLHHTVQWLQEEQRILSGKVMLRGCACVQAVFFREGQLRQQEYRIPFSQVVECDGMEPGDGVVADYQLLQSQVTLLEGAAPTLSCNLSGTVTVCVARRVRLPVLRDAYSTRFVTECTREPLRCPAWKTFDRTVFAEELCQPPEAAASVVDCRCRARGFVEEGGWPGAVYTLRMVYCCPMGKLHCVEHTVRVRGEEPVNAEQITVRAGWRDLTAQVEDGAIRVRFTALLQCRGLVEQTCDQVARCALDPNLRRPVPPAGTLVLRSVEPGETPWSIAKHYGSRVGQILSANKMESGQELAPGKLMLIPFSD
ncbi:MAG: DUF3794 domain-containing protein [Clostridia bacterium]|nr:DUF3794 domain-containing protein [Clostridia bacterium]